MADIEAIWAGIEALSPEEQEQLLQKLARHRGQTQPIKSPERVAGLFRGGWVSEDFDAALPDEFWGFDKKNREI